VIRLRDSRPLLFILALLVVAADRLSKLWVAHHIRPGGARVIIPKVFRITHVMNNGAAFSMFAGASHQDWVRIGLIAFSIAAATLMVVLILRMGRQLNLTTVAFALVLGGALGNLYDRIVTGEVLDFLEVHIVHYHYPDFNLADSSIVIGGILIFLTALRTGSSSTAKGK
jgi:signal peptidase II